MMPILSKTIGDILVIVDRRSVARYRFASRTTLTTLLGLSLLFARADAASPQGAPPGTETLVGRIVSDLDVPIAGAAVRALVPGRETGDDVRTGTDGRFVIPAVRRPVTIGIRASGFVPTSRSLVPPVDGYRGLAAAAQGPLLIRLERVAAISGTVRSEDGAPMAGALIEIYQRANLGTRRIWASAREAIMAGPDGQFTAPNLSPGEFVLAVPILATTLPRSVMNLTRSTPGGTDAAALVSLESSRAPGAPGPSASGGEFASWVTNVSSRRVPVLAPSNPPRTYRTTYFPAMPTLDEARVIRLASGEKRGHVDITVQTARASIIKGVLMDAGVPAAFTGVRLISADAGETSIDLDAQVAVTASDRTGTFSFFNVPEGRYRLKVTVLSGPEDGNGPILPRPSELRRWTDVAVTADRTVVDLGPIPLYKPVTVHGRIVLDDRSLPVEGAVMDVNVRASGVVSVGPPGLVRPAADGTFELTGLVRGRYEFGASVRIVPGSGGEPLFYLPETVVADGRDITRIPLAIGERDVTLTARFTRRQSGLFGTVRHDDRSAAPNAQVVIVPRDVQGWIADGMASRVIARTDANDTGGYAVRALPPGEYVAAALPADQLTLWPDPRIVESIASVGIPIRLEDGRWSSLDVPLRSSLPIVR